MKNRRKAVLTLEDGSKFEGYSFGAEASYSGEVVFNTSMTAYPESLTDPSYLGQILVSTYPLIGNYGVPSRAIGTDGMSEFLENEKIHPRAIICQNYSEDYSHWDAVSSLAEWLVEENVVGIEGIDTRMLTKLLRDKGSMLGRVTVEGCNDAEWYDPNGENLVAKASCKNVIEYGTGDKTVVLVDCGVKNNIIRCLVKRGVKVVRVPWDFDFNKVEHDGIFITNGPGNPDYAVDTVEHLRQAFAAEKPICGICMGNQLLSKAAGAKTYKLRYGHRSQNQPVREVGTNHCYITSQNHGFAVDSNSMDSDWEPLYVNMNDGTNEGIRHKRLPYFSTQFHPEACGGPTDTEFIFDKFVKSLYTK